MLYFRENVEHLKSLYSEQTLNFVVIAQDEGVCYLMDDILSKEAEKKCLDLGGKQDSGFFPLLKNMGIDLKYDLELSQKIAKYGEDDVLTTYQDLYFWNGMFYYYKNYLQQFDLLFANDVKLYIQRCEVLNLVIALFGSVTLIIAIAFASTYLKSKLSGKFMVLKGIFRIYKVKDIMENRYTMSYLQKFKSDSK